MSSHLRVSQTLELLNQLRETVRDTAEAEERLTRDFQTRTAALQKRLEDSLAAHDQQTAAALAQAEKDFQAARDRNQRLYEQRKARIAKAHKSSTRQRLQRIDDEEGRVKYHSQKGLLETERNQKQAHEQNDAAHAEFNQLLAENRESWTALEAQARKAFGGYRAFCRMLSNPRNVVEPDPGARTFLSAATSERSPEPRISPNLSAPPSGGQEYPRTVPEPDLAPDERALLEQLKALQPKASADLDRFQRLFWPRLFRVLPLWLWFVLAIVGGAMVPVLQRLGIQTVGQTPAILVAAVVLLLVLIAYVVGKQKAAPTATAIAQALEMARRLHHACAEKAQVRHAQEHERIEAEAARLTQMHNQNWKNAIEEAGGAREFWPPRIDEKSQRVSAKHEQAHQARRECLERDHQENVEQMKENAATRRRELEETHVSHVEKFTADYQDRWQKLESDWKNRIEPIYEAIRSANAAADQDYPAWEPAKWQDWTPPAVAKNVIRFARLEVDVKKLAELCPQDARLSLPGPATVSLPLVLAYPHQGSLLIETTKSGNESVITALNNIIVRLLATSPAGKVSFTIFDPVKLGQNFAGVMHLADYEDNLINNRIWTQTTQIEQRLADLNEHMEKVIQMYLRNEYESIADYNLEAGNIAEKYHFVVIADFPANFSESAARRLLHIAASGAPCGVYTLIHWDHRHSAPPDFFPEELRKSSVCIQAAGDQLILAHPVFHGARVVLDEPPDPDFATQFLHRVGEASRGSNRVEVPFRQVAPADTEMWTLDTTEELRVPIGRAGATKLQYLAIGKATRQHTLVAGKTGSGKSTLFHVLISNLALWCSPEQVEFYLVDFKKGVEFKCYAQHRLPHARVVAIESDREFGLSVLQRIDEELRRRGDWFRQLGVQDLAGYKKARGTEPMPRSLLLIDEFQEFFVEDDQISQAANVLLDRIVRQGRAFGIHAVLGSQTLGGAYTLARTTIGQMVIRIALQCNEADAYLIMDENNAAPRLLTRPGEGIYNDMAGAMEGNSPFQTVWLSEEERDATLEKVRARADQSRYAGAGPIVFEGNAPADVRGNQQLRALLEAGSIPPTGIARIWLGAPNSIKGPTEAAFQKRSGNNLLIVGQRDESVLAIVSLALLALAAQFPRGAARFVLLDSTAPGARERALLEKVVASIPHDVTLARSGELAETMSTLAGELKQRTDDDAVAAPATFVFIRGLQNFKKLRQDDDFGFTTDSGEGSSNPAAQLSKLVNEGAAHGIHLIATLDTYNNVNRFLGRKALSEFEMRVLFQMSANDSASLCDEPKASTLGLHRALFYNEQEGYLETFRPYAMPGDEWIDDAVRQLNRLLKPGSA